jgi:CspA family cold shock protein
MYPRTGTLKWFNAERGYGLISPDGGGEDLFVHHTGIVGGGFKYLLEGERVIYEATERRRGVEARNVSRAP